MTPKIGRVIGVSEEQASNLDPEQLLGRLTLFTLPDRPVSGAKLLRAWTQAGLDPDLAPPEARQPVDVFRSACASVKQRRGNGGPNHGRTEITADEVTNNGGRLGDCVYQITVKVWDTDARSIEFEKALRVSFDKRTGAISFDHLGGRSAALRKHERAIREHFEDNARTLPGNKVRNAVREQLAALGATNVRGKAGGAYFVPIEWQDAATWPSLRGLKDVLAEMYGDDADCYTIPLANDAEMQAMVRKHFTINVSENLEELTLKALERLRASGGRTVRKDMLANLWNDRREIVHAIDQFEQLVDLERQGIDSRLGALDEALTKLQDSKDDAEAGR